MQSSSKMQRSSAVQKLNNLAKRSCICLLFATMQGCISSRYEPVAFDSPVPLHNINVKVCQTDISGDPLELQVGQSCLALVIANKWLSPSNIQVTENQRYTIAVTDNQFWFDKDRRNTPNHGDEGNWAMNIFNVFKREQGLWFALTGATVECIERKEINRRCYYSSEKILEKHRLQNDMGMFNGEVTINASGYLAFYPNDAVVFGWRGFYKNNHGQVWLHITRMADVEAK